MAGGVFDRQIPKTRPGTYINLESSGQNTTVVAERGVALIPLLDHPYGPEKEFISILGSTPDESYAKLGYSVYDAINPGMLLVREALKNASEVYVYIPKQGAKATGTAGVLTATAKYGGTRGNAIKFTITDNPIKGFDVTVYLDTDVVNEYEAVSTAEDLIALGSNWVDFAGEGDLVANAGITLQGGTDGVATNADITQMLDDSEAIVWNTLAFPLTPSGEAGDTVPALQEAVASKIKYLRDEVGKYRKAVLANYAADYEGVINVTNSVVLMDGRNLDVGQVTAWVAGADAGASYIQSLTYKGYEGATGIIGVKNHAEATEAIKNGEFFFSFSEGSVVVVEYDINSLVTLSETRDATYRKNRVMRVFDTFAERLMREFPPNKFANSPTGWDVMQGLGMAILREYEAAGAIINVVDEDFVVDKTLSVGDSTYFNVGIEDVDSAEKLYFTVKTR